MLFIFPLDKQTPPTPEEMGHCDSVYLSEVGDTQVVVFKHGKEFPILNSCIFACYTWIICVYVYYLSKVFGL